jgi:CRP-like cAMP-binding protein
MPHFQIRPSRPLIQVNLESIVQCILALMDQLAFASTTKNGRDPRPLEGLLATLPIFHQVPRLQVGAIASLSRARNLRRGSTLYRRGERLVGVIAVGYGIMKLALRRPDGEEKVVRFLNPNETFGECTALLDRPCPVDVVALEDSMVAEIPAAPLLRLVERDPRFAHNVMCSIAERFLGLLAEHESSLQQSALQRLASFLASLAEPNGHPDTWVARLPASKTAVAARLGITKETMSRSLRELANRGLIAVAQREIEVRDLRALAQIGR